MPSKESNLHNNQRLLACLLTNIVLRLFASSCVLSLLCPRCTAQQQSPIYCDKLAYVWEERDSNPPTAKSSTTICWSRWVLQTHAVIFPLFKFQCSLILWLWLDSNQRGVLPHQFCRLLPSPLGTHSHYLLSKLLWSQIYCKDTTIFWHIKILEHFF